MLHFSLPSFPSLGGEGLDNLRVVPAMPDVYASPVLWAGPQVCTTHDCSWPQLLLFWPWLSLVHSLPGYFYIPVSWSSRNTGLPLHTSILEQVGSKAALWGSRFILFIRTAQSVVHITWELVRNAKSQTPPGSYWIINSGLGTHTTWVYLGWNKPTRGFWYIVKIRNHCRTSYLPESSQWKVHTLSWPGPRSQPFKRKLGVREQFRETLHPSLGRGSLHWNCGFWNSYACSTLSNYPFRKSALRTICCWIPLP